MSKSPLRWAFQFTRIIFCSIFKKAKEGNMSKYYEFKTVFDKFLFNCALETFESCCEVFLETVPGNFTIQCVIFSNEFYIEVRGDPEIKDCYVETFKNGLILIKGMLSQVNDLAPKNFTLAYGLIGDIKDSNKIKKC